MTLNKSINGKLAPRCGEVLPELLTIGEAARRLGIDKSTLTRRIIAAGIIPDAVLQAGVSERKSALFVGSRLAELRRLTT